MPYIVNFIPLDNCNNAIIGNKGQFFSKGLKINEENKSVPEK